MQVGEQDLALAHPVVFLRHRLLHLEHHLGVGPHVVGPRHDAGTCGQVGLVGECGAGSGIAFHQQLVPAAGQLEHPGRRDRDPVLMDLQLARNTDPHRGVPP